MVDKWLINNKEKQLNLIITLFEINTVYKFTLTAYIFPKSKKNGKIQQNAINQDN